MEVKVYYSFHEFVCSASEDIYYVAQGCVSNWYRVIILIPLLRIMGIYEYLLNRYKRVIALTRDSQ